MGASPGKQEAPAAAPTTIVGSSVGAGRAACVAAGKCLGCCCKSFFSLSLLRLRARQSLPLPRGGCSAPVCQCSWAREDWSSSFVRCSRTSRCRRSPMLLWSRSSAGRDAICELTYSSSSNSGELAEFCRGGLPPTPLARQTSGCPCLCIARLVARGPAGWQLAVGSGWLGGFGPRSQYWPSAANESQRVR
eukprot:COSAG01_NODE_177_length_22954_cov_28.699554_18_plen_191_part_00